MKLIILATIATVCSAGQLGGRPYDAPAQAYSQESHRPQAALERNAAILKLDSDVTADGFQYNFETENGIRAEETARAAEGVEAQGGFSYTGDDGQVYSVNYLAGQNGYQPQGAHLPVAPPIPEEILKALEQNARDEAAGIVDDGLYHEGKYADGSSQFKAAPAPQRAQYNRY